MIECSLVLLTSCMVNITWGLKRSPCEHVFTKLFTWVSNHPNLHAYMSMHRMPSADISQIMCTHLPDISQIMCTHLPDISQIMCTHLPDISQIMCTHLPDISQIILYTHLLDIYQYIWYVYPFAWYYLNFPSAWYISNPCTDMICLSG